MDKIKAIKDKYSAPTEGELIQALCTGFDRMEETLRNQEQHLLGLNTKLQELKSNVETSEQSLCTERKLLNEKLQELAACDKRSDELKNDKNKLLQEVHQLEIQRNTMKNTKPNRKDQQTLDHGKKKFEYYKQLSGIRWDFGAPKGTAKGYVTNGKDYISSFSYKTHEHGSKLPSLLWEDIGKATGHFKVAETNENRAPNN